MLDLCTVGASSSVSGAVDSDVEESDSLPLSQPVHDNVSVSDFDARISFLENEWAASLESFREEWPQGSILDSQKVY